MLDLARALFAADIAILVVVLAGVLRSIAVPGKRIRPPPRRHSRQRVLTWTCRVSVHGLSLALLLLLLLLLDWNAWRWRSLQAEVIAVRRAATMRGSNTDGVPRFALP